MNTSEDSPYLSGLIDMTKKQKGRRKEKHSPLRKQWKEKCKIINSKMSLTCLVSNVWSVMAHETLDLQASVQLHREQQQWLEHLTGVSTEDAVAAHMSVGMLLLAWRWPPGS